MFSIRHTVTKEEIQDFNNTISSLQQSIKEQIQPESHRIKVILIGTCGSGKSALSCSLARKDLKIHKDTSDEVILLGDGVSSGLKAMTQKPMII